MEFCVGLDSEGGRKLGTPCEDSERGRKLGTPCEDSERGRKLGIPCKQISQNELINFCVNVVGYKVDCIFIIIPDNNIMKLLGKSITIEDIKNKQKVLLDEQKGLRDEQKGLLDEQYENDSHTKIYELKKSFDEKQNKINETHKYETMLK